jgi:hypothetical protein
MLERLNRELKRRTRVATLFPNEASLLRLVTAILIEVSEEWETGKRYVTFETKSTRSLSTQALLQKDWDGIGGETRPFGDRIVTQTTATDRRHCTQTWSFLYSLREANQ